MLLGNPRQRLIYMAMAGMEMVCFALLFMLLYGRSRIWSPMLVFNWLFLGVLAWMLALEILGRAKLPSPRYEFVLLGLILGSNAGLVLFWPDPDHNLGNFFLALFDLRQGVPLKLALILVNLLLWQRAASASSRILSFYGVGLRFRFGMIVLIIEAACYAFLTAQALTGLIAIYFGLGLTAVALTRIDEKAALAHSVGPLMPPRRLFQFFSLILITVLITLGLSSAYSPGGIKTTLGWLTPLWTRLAILLFWVLRGLIFILEPVFIALEPVLRYIFSFLHWREGIDWLSDWFANRPEPLTEASNPLPIWVWVSARCLIFLAFIAVVGFLIWLFLGQIWQRLDLVEVEGEGREDPTFGGRTLGRGWAWLKNMGHLVRQYGLSRQLLAAISVENIYANISRIARQRGYPRHPALAPDDYLPLLEKAFFQADQALGYITEAYMRVHYGDQPLTAAELAQVRQAYKAVKQTPLNPP